MVARADFNGAQRRAYLLGVGGHHKNLTLLERAAFAVPAMLAGFLCTGCPVGADLDTPYNEYIVADNTSNVTSTTATTSTTMTAGGTTGGMMGCASAEPELVFADCAHETVCHGKTGMESPGAAAGLDLFSMNVRTALLDRPATGSMMVDCSAEKIIDTSNPVGSLLITSVAQTAPCGLEMPQYITTEPDAAMVQCITEWVNALVAGL